MKVEHEESTGGPRRITAAEFEILASRAAPGQSTFQGCIRERHERPALKALHCRAASGMAIFEGGNFKAHGRTVMRKETVVKRGVEAKERAERQEALMQRLSLEEEERELLRRRRRDAKLKRKWRHLAAAA